MQRGDVELGRNRLDAAIIRYTQAIKLDPSFADASVRRGIARRAKGDLNGAIQDFERAEDIDPRVAVGNQNFVVLCAYSVPTLESVRNHRRLPPLVRGT